MTNLDEQIESDIYDPDEKVDAVVGPQPLYQIYAGSKIPVSKQVGLYWHRRYDAAGGNLLIW